MFRADTDLLLQLCGIRCCQHHSRNFALLRQQILKIQLQLLLHFLLQRILVRVVVFADAHAFLGDALRDLLDPRSRIEARL